MSTYLGMDCLSSRDNPFFLLKVRKLVITAKIVCDSTNPNETRITTFALTLPRIILAEVNTHRMLAKNASSSRAIPVSRMIQQVETNPFIPLVFGKNRKGMQSSEKLDQDEQAIAKQIWLEARDEAVIKAKALAELGVHKQHANRLLEPFMYTSVVITGTAWANFFALRYHQDAQPEFLLLASKMAKVFRESIPEPLPWGSWHLPFILKEEKANGDYKVNDLMKMSTARCARVSYMTHEGKVPSFEEDLELHDRLLLRDPKHATPSEHPAFAYPEFSDQDTGCYTGWKPYRKKVLNENILQFPWDVEGWTPPEVWEEED